ncbi:MAG TPA: hypothetical protein VKZ81_31605 [Pseudonocardia sp.]|uniref:hypothetical protein n=1 Tax=Pseudonocardia sp. TaxID=60912 RepID=UPI002B4B5A7F|nr:hypothetical protein [Pseudonocardia sp.]HLU60030.1 hypothetical protein [Pseudonocardia sp.]
MTPPLKRCASAVAAAAVGAAAAAALFGGALWAGDPHERDGAPGRPGTGTATCRYLPPPQDGFLQCTSTGGQGGAGGAATDY